MEVIIDGIIYVPKDNKSEFEVLKKKYESGNYICITKLHKHHSWELPKIFRWDQYNYYKLIHKKHREILDAYLVDNGVIIEEELLDNKWNSLGCKQNFNSFIDVYSEFVNYRLKQEQYNDWRLPTLQELLTLVNYNKCNPASSLDDTLSDYYWSCLSYVSDSTCAWVVNFNHGDDGWYRKSNPKFVRCVRDGKEGLEWSATSELKMTLDEAIKYAKNLVAPVYYKG